MSECPCTLFDVIFRLNQVYLLLESKIQILLLKNLSQLSLDILLKSLIISYCKTKPISSGKNFLASERVSVLFYLAGVLVGIMLGLTDSNKEDK